MTIQTPIDALITSVRLGEPVTSGALFMIPLFHDTLPPSPAPLSLDEALAADLLQIEEISESGSVPELIALNISPDYVFLLDGEQVTGVKQNRTFNLSMLLAPGTRTTVPVSCLEHGRWSMRGGRVKSAEHVHFARGRAAKVRSVSDSLATGRSFRSDQMKVWADIDEQFLGAACYSPTSAEADFYEARREALVRLTAPFNVRCGQSGAVFGIGDRIVGLDLFGSPELYAKVADKLVRSYALDALDTEGAAAPLGDSAVTITLDRSLTAGRRPFSAPGVGETWRLEGEALSGAALVHAGACVHVAVFVG